jgi:ribonucleoside-diphosphate reductase alpha chain
MAFRRYFSKPGANPYEDLVWEKRSAVINDEHGQPVFEQHGIEVPSTWSQTATNIVASKYFRGRLGAPERENSVRQLISRVVDTITAWGDKQGYFATGEDLKSFSDDLAHLLVHQKAAFNSPVWFNVGIEKHPQASACFINSVNDTMDSILGLAKTEGMLFKFGSGTGSNLSSIRSAREQLAGGGTASGPVSFMRGYDAFAGVIKSGGKTRRAAKMVILNADHPDIEEFITSKADEERKAWALIEAGYDGSFNVKGGAYDSVFFQNANHSVRVTDEFMRAVVEDKEWHTRFVLSDKTCQIYKARDLMRLMAEAAWQCGDPGMQFDTIINDWHTCPNTARINASNPCSEYMFLDDTACNLASLNLMKFRKEDGEFDADAFRAACRTMITAQEILVDNASYPTPAIDRNSRDYRPLGLGYANLGVLLMDRGLPYDSDGGRAYAAAITALMHGEAYAQSARVAAAIGPFTGYAR